MHARALGYPLTPSMQDPVRLDEMARTIYIGNIGPGTREEDLIRVFSTAGPVAYVKMAGDPTQLNRFAFLEYVDVASANNALTLNNYNVDGRILKCVWVRACAVSGRTQAPDTGRGGALGCRVSKSKNTIVKPPKVTAQNARQVDDILRKVREAQTRIAEQYEQSLKAATGTKSDAATAAATSATTATATATPPAANGSSATEGSSSRRRRSRSRSPDRRRRHSSDRYTRCAGR
jgi:splicing factor, arginine/serine-rich 12